MTGIANKASQTGCNHCFDPRHWLNRCPHKDASGAEFKILRKKHTTSLRLLNVGNEDERESDYDPILGDLEGVALVSPTTGIIMRLDPEKIYLDSCASHIQVYLTRHLRDTFQTQIGIHTMSNGGQNTACEVRMLMGAIKAWLVRSVFANLFFIAELERRGFQIQTDTFAD